VSNGIRASPPSCRTRTSENLLVGVAQNDAAKRKQWRWREVATQNAMVQRRAPHTPAYLGERRDAYPAKIARRSEMTTMATTHRKGRQTYSVEGRAGMIGRAEADAFLRSRFFFA